MEKDATMPERSGISCTTWRLAVAAVLTVASATATGCANGTGEGERLVGPSVIEIRLPARFGDLRRPAVEFDHGQHTEALAEEDCKICHEIDDEKGVIGKFKRRKDPDDRDALMNLYHDECVACHQSRDDGGPVTCGECHVRRAAAVSTRVAMRFDYSLHQRHVLATKDNGEDDCEKCHHVVDEKTGKLVRKRGTEDACGSSGCHGDVDVGDNLSLRNASHRDCIRCHFQRRAEDAKAKRGPIECAGCHDEQAAAKREVLTDPPRLQRGDMPEVVWLAAPGVETNLVAFDHRTHEKTGEFCTSCHHDSMKACDECHTIDGSEDGDQVTLEQAYHRLSSEHSCVGCHEREARERDCAGCHARLPRPPGESSCKTCHNGPLAGTPLDDIPAALPELVLDPLPETSDEEFPDTIKIDNLAADYGPTEFPHRKIVENLDEAIRLSKLASQFHVSTRVLCAGCHHQSPVGTRPPACKACHDERAAEDEDRPSLKAAYHRQCIGCHQQMGIEKQGCTDCHEAAGKEVQQ